MKKKIEKALRLEKETIRALTRGRLEIVQGGQGRESAGGGCEQPTTQPDTHHTDTKTDLGHQ